MEMGDKKVYLEKIEYQENRKMLFQVLQMQNINGKLNLFFTSYFLIKIVTFTQNISCIASCIFLNALILDFTQKHFFLNSRMNEKHLSFKYSLRLLIMEKDVIMYTLNKLLTKMEFYSRIITDNPISCLSVKRSTTKHFTASHILRHELPFLFLAYCKLFLCSRSTQPLLQQHYQSLALCVSEILISQE